MWNIIWIPFDLPKILKYICCRWYVHCRLIELEAICWCIYIFWDLICDLSGRLRRGLLLCAGAGAGGGEGSLYLCLWVCGSACAKGGEGVSVYWKRLCDKIDKLEIKLEVGEVQMSEFFGGRRGGCLECKTRTCKTVNITMKTGMFCWKIWHILLPDQCWQHWDGEWTTLQVALSFCPPWHNRLSSPSLILEERGGGGKSGMKKGRQIDNFRNLKILVFLWFCNWK